MTRLLSFLLLLLTGAVLGVGGWALLNVARGPRRGGGVVREAARGQEEAK